MVDAAHENGPTSRATQAIPIALALLALFAFEGQQANAASPPPKAPELGIDRSALSSLRGYGEFLKAGAETLHDPQYYPSARIVTFGMAHGCDQCAGPPRHLSHPARAVAALEDVDGIDYLDNAAYHVDGYGTSIYPSPNDIAGSVTRTLRDDATALGVARPFWITEWGFLDTRAFPNRRGESLSQSLEVFLDTFRTLNGSIPIGPAMFYRYDSWLADASGKLLPQAQALSQYSAER